RIAVTIELEDFRPGIAAAPLPAYPYRADRLVRAASARTRHAGHRHGDAGAGGPPWPGHQLDRPLAAVRTVRFQRLRANAQQGLLGLVAVGRHAAIEPVGGSCDVGDALGDPAAGAALRGDQMVSTLPQAFADMLGQDAQRF